MTMQPGWQPGWQPMPVPPKPPAWLWIVPLATCGMGSFIPPLVIATKVKTKAAWVGAGAIGAAWMGAIALAGAFGDTEDTIWENFAGGALVMTMVASILFSLIMGPKATWQQGQIAPMGVVGYDPNQVELARVRWAKTRRDEARALASRDPQTARELRVGRPDLPRNYDDGGLVDINAVPHEAFVRELGFDADLAAQVIDVRVELGRFEHADDLVHLVGVDQSKFDQISDRIIVI